MDGHRGGRPSTEEHGGELAEDDAVRALLLLMPRIVSRFKRLPVPEELQALALAPRHLSLLSYLLFDGPASVNDLATRLEVAPTTVSLLVGELSRKGVLERREDETDRRRRIVSITEAHRPTISRWLARGADAWRQVLTGLSPAERALLLTSLRAYEEAMAEEAEEAEEESAEADRADEAGEHGAKAS
ncbi:MarR family winged helix-turn-helix transcriptional regulator [Streptomyces sp. NPDC006925]|uniref:MarR family winged helix-turn-helix transcriptional regulator n=1 Tax=Streptomyces sp. NPDC006925 TaxID=3364768 RepID=UPI0036CB22FC